MNTRDIHGLTLRLCEALDQNYDILNMDSVLSILSLLEGSPITKEQLEATRLAKFINHLRRRTKDENLARRAKSLLKIWREMVGMEQQQISTITQILSTDSTSTAGLKSAATLMHIEGVHQTMNSNQIVNAPAGPYIIDDGASPKSETGLVVCSEATKVYSCGSKKHSSMVSQHNFTTAESKAASLIGTQPSSFENVLGGLGNSLGDSVNLNINDESLKCMHTRNKLKEKLCLCGSYNTFKDDQSSNSEKISFVPSNIGTSYDPVIIDIQDSNSSNCEAIVAIKSEIECKKSLVRGDNLQKGELDSSDCVNDTTLFSKSKKGKKEKKHNDKHEHAKRTVDVGGGMKLNSVPLDDISSINGHASQSDKSRPTQPEVPSLLANTSMGSMYLPKGFTQNIENTSRRKSSNTTPDFNFTGKFVHDNDVVLPRSNQTYYPNTYFCSSLPSELDTLQLNSNSNEINSAALEVRMQRDIGIPILSKEAPQSFAILAEKALPRKRGRKKGSRGVDSVIAKEGRSSQRFITSLSSGNNKVKTTKELYAEIQNRKLSLKRSASPKFMYFPAPDEIKSRVSSCLGYRENDDESHCRNVISELSDDCFPMHCSRNLQPISFNSNLNSKVLSSKNITILSNPNFSKVVDNRDTEKQEDTIEEKLTKLLEKLPPVKGINGTESKVMSELVRCTCKVMGTLQSDISNNFTKVLSTEQTATYEVLSRQDNTKIFLRDNALVFESDEEDRNSLFPGSMSLKVPKKPNKSIFDLDFDDDPMYSLQAETCVDVSLKKENLEPIIQTNETKGTDNEKKKDQTLPMPILSKIPTPIFPAYKIVEDPMCTAKQRFEIQTQKITTFHLDALASCLVPNVNGNWDFRFYDGISTSTYYDFNYEITDDCNIIPRYDSLSVESSLNNLSTIGISKFINSKDAETTIKRIFITPFLGVAHSVLLNSTENNLCNHKSSNETKANDLGYEIVYNMNRESSEFGATKITKNATLKNNQTSLTSSRSHITVNKFTITSEDSTSPKPKLMISTDIAPLLVNKKNNMKADGVTVGANEFETYMFLPRSNILNSTETAVCSSVENTHTQFSMEFQKNCCDISRKCFNNLLAKEKPSYSSSSNGFEMTRSPSTIRDKYICRHSCSICSKPSVKESQCSINLKLKRKFPRNKFIYATDEGKLRRKKRRRFLDIKNENYNEYKTKKNKMHIKAKVQRTGSSSSDGNKEMRSINKCIHSFSDSEIIFQDEVIDRSEPAKKQVDIVYKYQQSNISCTESVPNTNLNDYEDDDEFKEAIPVYNSVSSTENSDIEVNLKKNSSKKDCDCLAPASLFNASNKMVNSLSDLTVLTTSSRKGSKYDTALNLTSLGEKIISLGYNENIEMKSHITPNIDLPESFSPLNQKDLTQKNEVLALRNSVPYKSKYNLKKWKDLHLRRKAKKLKTVAKHPRDMKLHRQLFFPYEISSKDYDGIKRNLLHISSCSSSCTEYSEHEYSNNSFRVIDHDRKRRNAPANYEINNKTNNTKRYSNIVQLLKSRLSLSYTPTTSYSYDNTFDKENNSQYSDQTVNLNRESAGGVFTINAADSNNKDNRTIACTAGCNINCNSSKDLPAENNYLLHSFNNVFITMDKVMSPVNYIPQYNGNIMGKEVRINIFDCPVSTDENQVDPSTQNKSCDCYNKFFNANRTKSVLEHFHCNCDNNVRLNHQQENKNIVQDSISCSHKTQTTTKHDYKYHQKFQFGKQNFEKKNIGLPYFASCSQYPVEHTDDENSNRQHFHNFKEWHQVLQLRSYNEELLTVLPYVVFD